MMKKIVSFLTFPAIVFLMNVPLMIVGTYDTFPWLDIPMHFLGGFVIAFMTIKFFGYFKENKIFDIKSKWLSGFLILCIVVLFAVLYEFLQFFERVFLGWNTQPSLDDTLLDLFMGAVGGVVCTIFLNNRL